MKLMIALGILLAQAPVQTSAQGGVRVHRTRRLESSGHTVGRRVPRWSRRRPRRAEGISAAEGGAIFFGRSRAWRTQARRDRPAGSDFVAGQFAKGEPLPSDDRQRMVDAFAEGEKAANEAASRFSKAGKQASAKFYAEKAKALREQLD